MSFLGTMSPDILLIQKTIQQNNDLYGGRDAIYKNRKLYIPQLEGQAGTDYDSMCSRTPIDILYPGVVEGFLGSTFIKEPVKELPDYEGFDNIDLMGNSIDQYTVEVVRQTLKQGFCASLVDYTKNSPFLKFISPESFVSIRVETVDDAPKITRFIFRESLERDDPSNEFAINYYILYTVLDLYNGEYRVRQYEDEEETQINPDQYPKMNGKSLDYIPITIHGTQANNYKIERSRLQDISDLNISVIQRTVDYTHMMHYTALPTPWIIGIDADDENAPSTIGPQEIWLISSTEASVGLLEFSGASADAHKTYITDLKSTMASIGAQILKDDGVARETATSVLIRNNAQTITISSIVNNITLQMNEILKTYSEWADISSESMVYKLNSDFVRIDMDANSQIALVKSWMDGAISLDSVFKKFKDGELVPSNRTFEEELELIKANPAQSSQLEKDKVKAEIKNMKDTTENTKNQMLQANKDSTGQGQNENPISGSNNETGTKVGNALSSKQL